MILRLATWLICCITALTASADDLIVRSSVIPEQPWIGQRVILQIDVLAPDAWAKVSRFGSIELAGAYVLPPGDQGQRLQETVEGTAYSGQRYEISIYPQRSGSFELEIGSIEVEVRQIGQQAESVKSRVALPPVYFDSRVPPGAEGIRGLVSTTEMTADQVWEPAPAKMQVGDAIKRSIRRQATGISGMAFEPLEHAPIEGLALYPDQPRVDDRQDRGTIEGARIETFTYVAERAGTYNLPEIVLEWWDTRRASLERIELPGATIKVMPGKKSFAPGTAGSLPVAWIIAATLVILLLLALFFLRHTIANWWKTWLAARKQTERYLFRVLERSVRTGDSKTILRNLMRWLDSIEQSERPARLDSFLTRYCEPPEREIIMRLQKAAMRDEHPFPERKPLLHALGHARKCRRKERREITQASATLPLLNPDQNRQG
ncbi:MAG: hypothetical protein PVJ65_03815 [Chromatiales bacterium]